MKKLQILIPQYKETDEVVKPLLDSIAVQQNINFNDIGVIICNDGSDIRLSESLLKSYPFDIEYHLCEHGGVSATRNNCLDYATADYVMFCDADDMFCDVCGLFIIFREMEGEGFDVLISNFREETRDPRDKKIVYINRENDTTFVHGKVERRQYLLDNKIRWNPSLTIHEDSYFNCLCRQLLKDEKRGKYCPLPFYLWKWRDESVCRHDPLYINKTYVNMLDSNTALVKQFLERNMEDSAKFYAVNMIYDAYYSFNCDMWWEGEGKEYLHPTEYRFKKYWKEFKWLFDKTTKDEQFMIVAGTKNRFFQEGLMLERITFNDWIKHIEKLKKPR